MKVKLKYYPYLKICPMKLPIMVKNGIWLATGIKLKEWYLNNHENKS